MIFTKEIILLVSSYYFVSRIKNDDRLIQAEGVESLSEAELREDCRERGMLGLLSVEEMQQQVFVLNILSFPFQDTVFHGLN